MGLNNQDLIAYLSARILDETLPHLLSARSASLGPWITIPSNHQLVIVLFRHGRSVFR